MKNCASLYVWSSLIAVLFATVPEGQAQDDVRITEFMASNSKTLQDEDHTYPDWIEIFNASTQAVNMLHWSLTDRADNLTKWGFPATNLAARSFLVVFADGKNRAVPGAPLHTSFSLSASGEYLGLVRPDLSIATEFRQFNGGFPPQAPDVSYGFGSFSTPFTVIATNAPVQWRIPNGSEGDWTGTNYDDSGWTPGTNGLGYGSFVTANYAQAVLPTQPVGYWRLDEITGTTAVNLGSGAADGTYTSVTLGTAGPRPPAFPGFEANNNAPTFNGSSSYVGGPLSLLSGRSAFTIGGWVNFASAPVARAGLFGQNDAVEFGFNPAGTLLCFTGGGGSASAVYSPPLNTWVHIAAVGDGTAIRLYVNGALLGSGGTATANYGTTSFNFNIGGGGIFDPIATNPNSHNGLIDEVVLYYRALSATEILGLYQAGTNGAAGASSSSLIRTDVSTAMSNVNASAYVRIPFVVTNATTVALVSLRMQYNDGFVASINGIEAVRVNAPDGLTNNSAATNVHASLNAEEFRLGPDTLFTGTNILAIQGLNSATNDTNFYISAEMVLTTVLADSPTPVYFTVPTPGATNIGGIANPGPAILSASNYPAVPLDSQDLLVSAKIVPTFYAVSNVVARYKIMFGSEIEAQMYDDGAHGDGAAGDGVFGAAIPESASTNGQMIRWYFLATDVRGNTSRWPLFADPSDSAEFLGTIVDPTTNLTSKLPIYHLFAPTTVLNPGPTTPQNGADSQTGGRVSIFYDGEFYDNVLMNLRGNTTAGFNKKSHHVNFNHEHPFRHTGPGGRILHTSFMADYIDPAYMRQGLSFWLAGQIGAPEPFYYPVRLQLNGQFYMLANHNDTVGAEQISRFGYDPNGALYKAAGVVASSQFSTGNFEKKTRLTEPNTDYQTLTTSISETNNLAQRRTNLFDMLDVPEIISYMVTARWAHENDDTWANMTLYRDSDGDGLWRIIPFDMNLSWGAIYYEGSTPLVIEGVQATNDIHKAFPMFGSTNALPLSGPASPNNFNRMYDVMFSVPETRQMFQRRMRTLLDTYILPIGTPTNTTITEQKILAWRDLIADEARLDRIWWGWQPKGGQNNFDPPPNSGAFGTDLRTNAATVALSNGVYNLLYAPTNFFLSRRAHFYGKHSVTNTALPIGFSKDQNAGIPLAQPPNASINLLAVEANPASGNQAQEYISLTNPAPFAVDISGWKLGGAIDFTFKPGTVMISNSVLYVARDLAAFRVRTVSPHGGQALFVTGPYQGQLSARGETIRITDDVGRLVGTSAYPGNPSLAQQFLRITELMYHPAPLAGNTNAADEFEYIEFKNISPDMTLDLNGVRFTNGVEFAFSGSAITSLGPGERVLIVKNMAAFSARYGSLANIAGVYSGSLDNAGERIQLLDVSGEEILDFSYDNKWYPFTDGFGFSLVIVDEQAQPDAWGSKSNWTQSGQIAGSPGIADPAPPAIVPVVVNEALTRTDFPPPTDTIELFNPTAGSADLSGWFLSDDFQTPKKYRIPDGTILPAGSYQIFDESQFNPHPGVAPSFSLSGAGDEIYLFSASTNGDLTGYFHGFNFGAGENGVSFGRYVSSEGKEHFVAQLAMTLGTNNAGPRVGPIVINEIMYHPPETAGGNDNTGDEFIELLNISGSTVSLFDGLQPPNTWKLTGGIDWTFPTNITVQPGQYLLLVNFNPTNDALLAAFRSKYGFDPAVPVFGPYAGKLNNDGDDVELKKPTDLLNGAYPYVLVDKVDYKDSAPWPGGADGFGLSLQRKNAAAFGNDPANWLAALPTAAAPSPASGTPPVLTSQPASQTVLGLRSMTLSVTATGDPPLRYQWRFNGANVAGATNADLSFSNVLPQNAGDYEAVVFNNGGSTVSSNATISVILGAAIQTHPRSLTIATGTNANFSVQAYSPKGASYQWRFNGNDIAGATNATFTVFNVQFANDGEYTVVVSDPDGAITSSIARLTVYSNYGWRYASVTGNLGTITNLTLATNVYIWMQSAGEAYIDDVSLVPLSGTYAGINVVTNGDFEAPLNVAPPWIVSPSMTNSARSTLYAHSGTYSLHVVATNGGSANPPNYVTQHLPPISTNILCTLSFWYHTIANSTNLVVRTFPGSLINTTASTQPSDASPAFASQPNSLVLSGGATASFSVSAFGSEPLTYQWLKNGTPLANGGTIGGATTANLTVSPAGTLDNGNYSVKVSNIIGSTNSAVASLTVTGPPTITTQPQTQQANCYGSVTFTVVANGTAPLLYQWSGNHSPLLNATNASLTLTNLSFSDSGPYSVAISNQFGSTNSSDAILTVVEGSAIIRLDVHRDGTNLVVIWPRTCTAWVLEENLTLDPATWSPAAAPIQDTDTLRTAIIPIGNDIRFYRLRD